MNISKRCVLVVGLATGLATFAGQQPNIVLIFADDLGYGDLGCYGATKVQTPNIDQLAAQGRRFTDAHSASAVCTPSRYGLLTGEYPSRKKIWGPCSPTSKLLIDVEKMTIASLLKQKGYETSCFGKWHLGFGLGNVDWSKPLRPGPLDLGFDYYFGVPVVNSCSPYVFVENDRVVGLVPDDPLVYLGRKSKEAPTPITPLPPEAGQRSSNFFGGGAEAHGRYNDYAIGTTLARKATGWIRERKDKPFFVYLATTNIHHPFTPAPRFQGTSQCGLYGDFIHELDWMVGEVVKALEEQGVAENTLILFTSDNGGMFNHGGQAAFADGHRQNGDLLGFKFGAWEGGHRVPFIAKWPGRIEPGTTSDQLICNVDMLATFAALTEQTVEKEQLADSVNVLPALLEEPAAPLRDTLLLSPHRPSHLAVRKGKWMYIPTQGEGGFRGGPGSHGAGGAVCASFVGSVNSDIENGRIKKDAPPAQLYDLDADVRQTTNLYNQYPEVVQQMKELLAGYAPPKPAPAKKKTASMAGAAPKIAASPSDKNASFDFESGVLEPWNVVEGHFGHPIGNRAEFFRNGEAYNKQGEYYLTTLEPAADADRGMDAQTGVVVSPLFIPKGGKMTFRIGGGKGAMTYAALCAEDGKEVERAQGVNSQTMQKASWNLEPYTGKKMYIKIADKSTDGWGHVVVDDFRFDAEVLAQYPEYTKE
ncbi:Arylsulfatase [Pontiella desulfatans]|uniref:Arylsulfatase n=1 Tax=Pontiella desulfatans TaxID=2750659 RepID=A0A6C2U1M3_PONDE|nr:arylsulfatase [Pontiella desulfatans]SPS73871.1 sulfatase S1_14,S1_15 [Kiritimatiellales bacterium]VGO13868.1 Arylsulfatase [Pontiella desulfatans]